MLLNLSSNTYIETKSKIALEFTDPTNTEFSLEDIALGLSHACRFAGQVPEFYSVAQHSVLVARLAYNRTGDPEMALAGLMHDASEAYTGDLTKPLKNYLGEVFTKLEDQLMRLIAAQHDVRQLRLVEVKQFDAELYDIEEQALRRDNRLPFVKLTHLVGLEQHGRYWNPRLARQIFIQEYRHFQLLIKQARGYA